MAQGKHSDHNKHIKDLKLSTLLELTNAINNNLTEEELFILFEHILKNQLNIGRAVIYLNQESIWRVALQYGVLKQDLMINIEHQLKQLKDITVLETSRGRNSQSFDVVIPILHQSKALAYLLLGDLDEDARKASPIIKHLSFIQTLANITSVAVENKRLEREHFEQERLIQELRLASQMQEMLLPKVLPMTNELQVAAYYKPHREVGGDFYDIIRISPAETVFCIADVSGKGMAAAIIMANFQANLRANLKVEVNLAQVIKNLNETVWENAMGERFVTCFLAKYNSQLRTFEYINAAHPAAVIIEQGLSSELAPSCVGIGMFEEMPSVECKTMHVQPNALFICFTDGISETENVQEKQFQQEEMAKTFLAAESMSVQAANEYIIRQLDAFRGKSPYNDDVALISCRFL